MNGKKLLVTMCLGDGYLARWQRRFADNFNAYARKHGCDVLVIDDYIDKSPKSRERAVHWQKCLVLEHPGVRDYDQVAWIDADILINPTAPSVFEDVPRERVGAVSHCAQYRRSRWMIEAYDKRFAMVTALTLGLADAGEDDPVTLYRLSGFDDSVNDFINTGVLVLSPEHHAPILRRVYDTGVQNEYSIFENLPLSHALLKSDKVRFIDEAFNVVYAYEVTAHYPYLWVDHNERERMLAVNSVFARSYFLHFTNSSLREDIDLVQRGPDSGRLRAVESAWNKAKTLK